MNPKLILLVNFHVHDDANQVALWAVTPLNLPNIFYKEFYLSETDSLFEALKLMWEWVGRTMNGVTKENAQVIVLGFADLVCACAKHRLSPDVYAGFLDCVSFVAGQSGTTYAEALATVENMMGHHSVDLKSKSLLRFIAEVVLAGKTAKAVMPHINALMEGWRLAQNLP